jgi:hypothetical protein
MRAYEESVWTGQGVSAYCSPMAKSDPDKLAAALRENLRKRKAQARAHGAQPSNGADEAESIVVSVAAKPSSETR